MALGGIVCGLFSYQAVASDYSANLNNIHRKSRQSSAPQDLAAEFGRGDLLQHQFDCSVSGCRNGGLAIACFKTHLSRNIKPIWQQGPTLTVCDCWAGRA